ncbi:MAG TPA: galactose-1-epimerase, partial [Archangium sp.]
MAPGGQPVDVYTLTNRRGVEARVTNYGGIILSLRVPDRNGRFDDVVLGYDSLAGYLAESPYFGALIGRYGNRIA